MAAVRSSVWYLDYGNGSSTGYYAVPVWATTTSYTVGTLVRPLTAPAVGNERLYVCTVPGLSVTEPTWTFAKGDINAGTVESFQECTGQPGVNQDAANTPIWSASNTWTKGQVITNIAGTGWFIAKTSGTSSGSQPAGLATPVSGADTTDNTVTWTCIKTSAFAKWAAPAARLPNAFTANWGAAGDDFYTSEAHAETQASAMTLASPGTTSAPCRIICVDHTGSVPPVSADLRTTATISTTGANSITFSTSTTLQYTECYGITFQAGSAANAAQIIIQTERWIFYSCGLTINNTNSTGAIMLGINNQTCANDFYICTMTFGATGQGLNPRGGRHRFFGGSIGGATFPTAFYAATSGTAQNMDLIFDGFDFSALGAGKTIVGAMNIAGLFQAVNCKVNASVTLSATPTTLQVNDFIITDSTSSNSRRERYTYGGPVTTETTIVKSGGSSDGVTPYSYKFAANGNAKKLLAVEGFQIAVWNTSTGSAKTATIEIVNDGTTMTNKDIWMEVEYLGNASFPISSLVSSYAADILAAASNLPTSSVTWTTTGLGSPVKQYLQVTFTPQMAGLVRATVKTAKASKNVYVDDVLLVA